MASVFIGLGSNLGDRERYIRSAVDRLCTFPHIQSVRLSSLYETEPIGGPAGQERYLNAAAAVETTFSARELLETMRLIEDELGRIRDARWGPRTIDLDLLLYDDLVMDTPGLIVPHPRMHERRFVLVPLAEIAPNVQHPRLKMSVSQLLARCP